MSQYEEQKVDYSTEVQNAIDESFNLLESSSIQDAIEFLSGMEKKCRTDGDLRNLKDLCVHMLRMCRESNDWDFLLQTLLSLAKKRSQSKGAITAMVNEGFSFVATFPSTEQEATKVRLIEALSEVTEGKIYLESEAAKLAMMLSKIREANGDIVGASAAIQDMHVETFGSMSKFEKADYILDQVRLTLAKGDFVRGLIASKKIHRNTLEEKGYEQVKVRFYNIMLDYFTHEKDPWEIAQCYYNIWNTSTVKARTVKSVETVTACVLFLLLSPPSSHLSDMRMRLLEELKHLTVTEQGFAPSSVVSVGQKKEKNEKKKEERKEEGEEKKGTDMQEEEEEEQEQEPEQLTEEEVLTCSNLLAAARGALQLFVDMAILPFPFDGLAVLETHACLDKVFEPAVRDFDDEGHVKEEKGSVMQEEKEGKEGEEEGNNTAAFGRGYWLNMLRRRVIQKNLFVISKYYTRISTSRLSSLLGEDMDTIEDELCDMVISGWLWARIDRPGQVVQFARSLTKEERLNEWSGQIDELMGLVEKTCHLIQRENMVHKIE